MSAAHPLCFKRLRDPGDDQRVPMLKRRMSAPAESSFVNPSSVTRKKLRLSEPDDLSTRSSQGPPRNNVILVTTSSLGQQTPSIAINEYNLRISDVEVVESAHKGPRRSSRTLLATMKKGVRAQTARPKPNLSVRIPSPAVMKSSASSPIVRTPTSPLPSSGHPDNKLTSNKVSGPSTRRNPQQQRSTTHSPHTPATPLDQVIVRRPTNPPAIKPRYFRGNDIDGDEAYNRRVERLFAPTPTEWSFSSTLNRVPTPLDDYFDRLVSSLPEEASSHGDESDRMPIDDDIMRVSSPEAEGPECELRNFSNAGRVPAPAIAYPSNTVLNNIPVQPLASPYATRFSSPAASIISLAPSGLASGTSTPRSISPVTSYSSARSRTNSNSIGGSLSWHENTGGVRGTSVPFPSLFSPAGPNLPGPGSGGVPPSRRSTVAQRRSSLGPNRLSIGSNAGVGNGGVSESRLSTTTGYFDCRPPLSTTAAHAEASSAPVSVEMELDDCSAVSAGTPALDA